MSTATEIDRSLWHAKQAWGDKWIIQRWGENGHIEIFGGWETYVFHGTRGRRPVVRYANQTDAAMKAQELILAEAKA